MCVRIRCGAIVKSDTKKVVFLLMSAILALVVVHGAFADNDDATIKALGIHRGEPIDKGFFFSKGVYIEAPYVVERRGTDIYVNDHLLHPGMGLPRYDYSVSEDPGEPPADISPFDPVPENVDHRDTYWSRKLRYLLSHYPRKDAAHMMLETWRKCQKVKNADLDNEDKPLRAALLSTDGQRKTVILTMSENLYDMAWTKEQILEMREDMRKHYENALRADVALFDIGPEIQFPPSKGVKAINILMSSQSVQEKIAALGLRGVGVPPNLCSTLVAKFRGSPQLKERVRKLEKELEMRRLQTDIMADARTATDAIADIGMAQLSGRTSSVRDGNGASDAADKDQNASPLHKEPSPAVVGIEDGNSGSGRTLTFVALALFLVCAVLAVAYNSKRRRKTTESAP